MDSPSGWSICWPTPPPTIVGIDHAFSFPLLYFEAHHLPPDDWGHFLDDFQHHWPTDTEHTYVDFVRNGSVGDGAARTGSTRWRRLTELRAGGAKSVFHFDVQGQVAKSTHAGIPWLRFLRQRQGERVHFWPFDGWQIPADRSAVVEVYPALWKRRYPRDGRNDHQQDAFAVATWLRDASRWGNVVAAQTETMLVSNADAIDLTESDTKEGTAGGMSASESTIKNTSSAGTRSSNRLL